MNGRARLQVHSWEMPELTFLGPHIFSFSWALVSRGGGEWPQCDPPSLGDSG